VQPIVENGEILGLIEGGSNHRQGGVTALHLRDVRDRDPADAGTR
jgi:hypothetical protein